MHNTIFWFLHFNYYWLLIIPNLSFIHYLQDDQVTQVGKIIVPDYGSEEIKENMKPHSTQEFSVFWRIDSIGYPEVLKHLEKYGLKENVPVVRVPEKIVRLLWGEDREIEEITEWEFGKKEKETVEEYISKLERNIPFRSSQRYSVKFGIEQRGRVFLANDRNMGKTLEALCIAMKYKHDFPLMILCAAGMRDHWRKEILKWFSAMDEAVIKVIEKATESFNLDELIYIWSYDSASKLFSIKDNKKSLSKFQSFILDDAHEFKSTTSKKVKALKPFLKNAKHIIFWSAVPRIVSPSELYLYMNLLRPDIFNSYAEFATRYWKAMLSDTKSLFLNDKGFSKSKELNLILYEKLMVRFVSAKNQKPGERVLLEVELDNLLKTNADESYRLLQTQKSRNQNEPGVIFLQQKSNNSIKYITSMRKNIGLAKIKSTVDFINSKIQKCRDHKSNIVVFYCHNIIREMLIKELEGGWWKVNDFSKTTSINQHKIKSFNESEDTEIALIKINRISSKFELTSAEIGIFWELSFSPFDHIVAEKIVLGENLENKEIYYIVGRDSKVDNWMLSKLQQKQWTHSIYFHNDKKWRDYDKHSAFNFKTHHIPSSIKHYLSQNDAYESTAFSNNKNSGAMTGGDLDTQNSLFANSQTQGDTQEFEEAKVSQENRLSKDDVFSDNSQTVKRIRVSWDNMKKRDSGKRESNEMIELEINCKNKNNWYSLPQFDEKEDCNQKVNEPEQENISDEKSRIDLSADISMLENKKSQKGWN